MAVAAVTSAPVGPLNSSQQDEVTAAHLRGKKVRKAAGVAAFNGWVTAIFAVVSIPFAFFSVSGFLVALGLSIVAYNEFRGRRRLLSFDASGAPLLGWNQVGFLGIIILYCIWMLFTALTGESPIAAEMHAKPELAAVMGEPEQFDQLYRLVVVAVYGSVIVLSVIFQGLNAVYYFTRRRHVEDYVLKTPDWVLELQRLTSEAGASR